jgi:DNA-binding GntR family transcriptional regulator
MKISRTNISDEVSNWLVESIEKGQYKTGDRLPSVEQLALDLNVGRSSVREALRQLQALGLVTLQHGKGTFVSAPKLQLGSSLTSFSESVRERGMEPGGVILKRDIIPATEQTAADLRLDEDELVNLLMRLRLADGEPVAIETSYTPNQLFPDLLEGPWSVETSLYEIMQNRYSVQLLYAIQTIIPIQIDNNQSQLLQVPPGTAAIELKSVTFGQDNVPIESASDVYHPGRYQYTVTLRR